MSEKTYGKYILSTGSEIQGWEKLFTKWIYSRRFAGMSPILELGPGRCAFVRQAPESITAIDTAVDVVEYYAAQGLDVRVGDACELPFPDNHFEAIYSCWLLEHIPKPDLMFAELRRVIRPGGYVCLIVPSDNAISRGFYDDWTHIRPYTRKSLDQLAAGADFDRWSTQELVWTRGLRRLLGPLGMDRMLSIQDWLDQSGRRLGLTNKYNLVFEAWPK